MYLAICVLSIHVSIYLIEFMNVGVLSHKAALILLLSVVVKKLLALMGCLYDFLDVEEC